MQGDQNFLFYFVAVPMLDGILEEDPNRYKALVYSQALDTIQFADLKMVEPMPQPAVLAIDVSKAQKATLKFLNEPVIIPVESTNEKEPAEALEPESDRESKYSSSVEQNSPTPQKILNKRKTNRPSKFAQSPIKIGRFTYYSRPQRKSQTTKRSLTEPMTSEEPKSAPNVLFRKREQQRHQQKIFRNSETRKPPIKQQKNPRPKLLLPTK